MKLGLCTASFELIPRAKPRTSCVLPVPRSPISSINLISLDLRIPARRCPRSEVSSGFCEFISNVVTEFI